MTILFYLFNGYNFNAKIKKTYIDIETIATLALKMYSLFNAFH